MRARILSLMTALLLSGLAAEVLAQAQVPSPETPSTQRISADLITRADALKIADASITACERQGEKTAAMVSDADGFLRAALSSDGLNPIGLHTATLKTVAVLRVAVCRPMGLSPSLDSAARRKPSASDTMAAVFSP